MNYNDFLLKKMKPHQDCGIKDIPHLSDSLFPFQNAVVEWALKRGRSALFAGTGLGKTFMQLSWANALYEHEKARCLILTPLAVSSQTEEEAAHWGIDAKKADCQDSAGNSPIVISNYQKIEKFDFSKFDSVVLDESSILKNEKGSFRTMLIEKTAHMPYRLAATATPAPNDFMELGNHAEFCGIMRYSDMLPTFFTHDGSSTQNWRLKGHAESRFWEWMATWSCMFEHPRDLGYEMAGYDLPALHHKQHIVSVDYVPNIDLGTLFPMQAANLSERHKARKASISDRCKKAAEIVNDSKEPFVIWCHLNEEGDVLKSLIPDAAEVRGSDSDNKKLQTLSDFKKGNIRVLITKPSICGAGMNWQHCANTVFVGLNDSFEQVYQAIRRFWRFGQKREVVAHFIASESEGAVVANINRKQKQAEKMMKEMVSRMCLAGNINAATMHQELYQPTEKMELPSWI